LLHSRRPNNNSAKDLPNLNAKYKDGTATNNATDHLTNSKTSTAHSFKDIAGLTGTPEKLTLMEKVTFSIDDVMKIVNLT